MPTRSLHYPAASLTPQRTGRQAVLAEADGWGIPRGALPATGAVDILLTIKETKACFQLLKDHDAYGIRAVDRAATVLGALGAATGPRNLTAVAEAAHLSVPTTFRLLRTLQHQGLVMPSPDGNGYTLGFRILELAHALQRQLDIVSIARPYMMQARDAMNETVGLVVRSGDFWVPIASVEATQSVRRVINLGEQVPLYADSAGRTLLSGMTDDEIEDYVSRTPLRPYSASTVVDASTLRARIAEVRRAGVTFSINERGAGGAGVAAPVWSHDGRMLAVITAAAPASRFDQALRNLAVKVIAETAGAVSQSLGYRGRPPSAPAANGRSAQIGVQRPAPRALTSVSGG